MFWVSKPHLPVLFHKNRPPDVTPAGFVSNDSFPVHKQFKSIRDHIYYITIEGGDIGIGSQRPSAGGVQTNAHISFALYASHEGGIFQVHLKR